MGTVERDLEGRLSVKIGGVIMTGSISMTEYEEGLGILELAGGTQRYICEQRSDGVWDILGQYIGE